MRESYSLEDISKYKKVKTVLMEGEKHFRNIFEVAPIGLALTDRDFHLIKANDVFCQILDHSEYELQGINVCNLHHSKYYNKNIERITGGEISSFVTEICCNKKNKEQFWVRANVIHLSDDKRAPTYYLIMIEDIIRCRLAEETKNNAANINKLTEEIVINIGEKVKTLQETLQGFVAQSEEFSASSEEVATATEEQTAAMHQLTSSAQDLIKLSEELASVITKFSL